MLGFQIKFVNLNIERKVAYLRSGATIKTWGILTMEKHKYQITYFDPADEEGRREKTWKFRTIKGATAQQEDLSIVWDTPKEEISIEKVK